MPVFKVTTTTVTTHTVTRLIEAPDEDAAEQAAETGQPEALHSYERTETQRYITIGSAT